MLRLICRKEENMENNLTATPNAGVIVSPSNFASNPIKYAGQMKINTGVDVNGNAIVATRTMKSNIDVVLTCMKLKGNTLFPELTNWTFDLNVYQFISDIAIFYKTITAVYSNIYNLDQQVTPPNENEKGGAK